MAASRARLIEALTVARRSLRLRVPSSAREAAEPAADLAGLDGLNGEEWGEEWGEEGEEDDDLDVDEACVYSIDRRSTPYIRARTSRVAALSDEADSRLLGRLARRPPREPQRIS